MRLRTKLTDLPAVLRLRAGITGVVLAATALTAMHPAVLRSQEVDAAETEVIQLVTFHFAPGGTAEAIRLFRDRALPLYVQNPDMLEFRAYREVESPSPLSLVVVSRFRGMAGMDRSNDALRALAADAGTSIGEIYGGISAVSVGHTDEFVEIELGSALASMDNSHLVVLEYLEAMGPSRDDGTSMNGFGAPLDQVLPVGVAGIEGGLAGPMVIADGWGLFRMYGAASLGAVHTASQQSIMRKAGNAGAVTRRKRVVLARVAELSVR